MDEIKARSDLFPNSPAMDLVLVIRPLIIGDPHLIAYLIGSRASWKGSKSVINGEELTVDRLMGTRGEINNQTGSERIDKRSFILSRVCDRHVYMNNINIYRSNLKRNSLQLSIGNINLFRLRKVTLRVIYSRTRQVSTSNVIIRDATKGNVYIFGRSAA